MGVYRQGFAQLSSHPHRVPNIAIMVIVPLRRITSNAFDPSWRAIASAKIASSLCRLFSCLQSLNWFSAQNMHMWVLEAESLIVILDDITTNKEFV